MNSTEHSTTPVTAPAPTIEGVDAGLLELISLLEVIEDLSGNITFRKPDAKDRQNIARVQNLISIAVHYARHTEARVDDFANSNAGAQA